MRRREFILALGGAAALPLPLSAQQPGMPVIGFLGSETADAWASRVRAFHQGLSETGHVEGRTVSVLYRWAEGHTDRLPQLAADLVRRQVAVIAVNGPAVAAAKTATSAIPIVFQIGGDPVAAGLVASLSRPGGNLTGVTSLGAELGQKKLELSHGLVPTATMIAALVNPSGPNAKTDTRDFEAAARALGVELHVLHASTERDVETAFAAFAGLRAGVLVIGTDAFFNTQAQWFAALSLRYGVPTVFQFREFAAAGGLMSYGDSLTDRSRQVGVYAGRILNGENSADLPVIQAARVELIINLKTARALGIAVPLPLLGRADEVIE